MSKKDSCCRSDSQGSCGCEQSACVERSQGSSGHRASRRAFLKGVVASGAVVSASSILFRGGMISPARAATAAGSVERLMSLNINGQTRRVDVLPHETLAQTLRYKLGLTGTKLACDRGECGACTVIVDGVNIYSCTVLTHRVRNGKITTIEGIAGPDGGLHKVQKAFISELGPQCGFCTPGQIMSAVALLDANPNPTIEEARLAMSGNLCRCGAYDHYLRSVMAAAKEA